MVCRADLLLVQRMIQMQIGRENVVFTLTPEELEEAYREKELEYRVLDAFKGKRRYAE